LNKNTKIVILTGILALFIVVLVSIWRAREKDLPRTVDCGPAEGVHHVINERQFATQYTGYTLTLEGELKDKAKFSAKLGESQFQQLSDALQQGNEFRKALVAGYNACAISKDQYSKQVPQFQAIDSIASQINVYTAKHTLKGVEQQQLQQLIQEYVELTNRLAR
jgi:hypothetical protein